MRILLIAGGWSSEREVSLSGAKSIRQALIANGHEVTFFDLLTGYDNLLQMANAHDFAFINLHGAPGEDGMIQAMLDSIGCPYQGAGAAGSFLALHKAAAKQIFRFNGLLTPDWQFLPQRPDSAWQPSLPYPLFVKSNTGGSSLHLCRARDRAELDKALEQIFSCGEEALIEPETSGKDITCGILGNTALPPVLIEPVAGDFFEYESKYAKGGSKETCPAPIDDATTLKIQEIALQAHAALGLQGCSRADFILNDELGPVLLEVNTLPGMTSTSLVPQEAAAIGMDFPALVQKLVDLGLQDHPKGRKD